MNARDKNYQLMDRMDRRSIELSYDEVNELRRISLTLSSWCEKECGDSSQYASWSIERDEKTDLPYLVTYYNNGKVSRYRIADKEKGALKRAKAICEANGLFFYYQTDPRGCALYISNEPLTDQNYTNGLAMCN